MFHPQTKSFVKYKVDIPGFVLYKNFCTLPPVPNSLPHLCFCAQFADNHLYHYHLYFIYSTYYGKVQILFSFQAFLTQKFSSKASSFGQDTWDRLSWWVNQCHSLFRISYFMDEGCWTDWSQTHGIFRIRRTDFLRLRSYSNFSTW